MSFKLVDIRKRWKELCPDSDYPEQFLQYDYVYERIHDNGFNSTNKQLIVSSFSDIENKLKQVLEELDRVNRKSNDPFATWSSYTQAFCNEINACIGYNLAFLIPTANHWTIYKPLNIRKPILFEEDILQRTVKKIITYDVCDYLTNTSHYTYWD